MIGVMSWVGYAVDMVGLPVGWPQSIQSSWMTKQYWNHHGDLGIPHDQASISDIEMDIILHLGSLIIHLPAIYRQL